jgi:hypothetical protein
MQEHSMSLSDKYLIACCLEKEEYRHKYKKIIRSEKIIDERLQKIANILKEGEFSFELLYRKSDRENLSYAIELANWSAFNEITTRHEQNERKKYNV